MSKPWYLTKAPEPDQQAFEKAEQHQSQLTKPPGSLGELESIALQFAAWQKTPLPKCEKIILRVFAGDHGICRAENNQGSGVSAFPQAVTAQMIHNFINGGAAINVLSKQISADFAVVNMGTVQSIDMSSPYFINHQLMNGTNDFTKEPAMSADTLELALAAGRDELMNKNADLFVAGEMGIGNTTSASAIYSLLLKVGPEATVGNGTGVDKDGLIAKRKTIYKALNCHGEQLDSPLAILQFVGGLEIAALVGAYIASAQQGVPIMVDGFIATAAALLAVEINPSVRPWMMFAHQSAEKAHKLALEKLNAKPILNLGLRLGEGSGAALAVPLIQSALALHSQMATFAQANVSE